MAEIKNLVFMNKAKYKNLVSVLGTGFLSADLTFNPLSFINYLLPLKFKFLPESFAITEDKKIQAIICLEKDNKNKFRYKITKLFMEQNALDAGRELINFVVSKYCAKSVSTFIVAVDEHSAELANLFLKGCNFRVCANEFIYKLEGCDYKSKNSMISLKTYKNSSAEKAAMLCNCALKPELRPTLLFMPNQFNSENIVIIDNKMSFKYVLENDTTGNLIGFFSLSTLNNKDYILSFALDCAYNPYFKDIIGFLVSKINSRGKNWTLYVKIKDYFLGAADWQKQSEDMNFKRIMKNIILSKDYLRTVKQDSILKSARIIFNDVTPAFKVRN